MTLNGREPLLRHIRKAQEIDRYATYINEVFKPAMRSTGFWLALAAIVCILLMPIIIPIRALKWLVTGTWKWRLFDGKSESVVG